MKPLTAPLRPTFKSPLHPGTVAQFREGCPIDSWHVLVYPDGTWMAHVDRYNPDAGSRFAVAHALRDVCGGGKS